MASEAGKMLVEKVKKFRAAVKYLDGCGEMTLEKLQKASDISGTEIPARELRTMWEAADLVLPLHGQPGGKEFVRFQMRKTLEEGISTFSDLARKMGVSESELKGGGCFIATACYGSETADEVILLQGFRDDYLSKSGVGRLFVYAYYAISPRLAIFIGRRPALRRLVKAWFVNPVVSVVKKLK